MWLVLLIILIVICLFKHQEPFQNKTPDTQTTSKEPEPKPKPEPKPEPGPKPYVQRNHVGLKEPLDSRLKCPSYYEDINKDILVEYQKISDAAYGYTPNRYLDVTRFVDTTIMKEPLPIEPDFFIHLK